MTEVDESVADEVVILSSASSIKSSINNSDSPVDTLILKP